MVPPNLARSSEDERSATRLTRRAANAAASATVAFWALFVFSAEIPVVRAHSPWAEDPYDAVVSFAALLVPVVAAVTFVRCQRWRGQTSMPTHAVRLVLRGVGLALLAIGATVVADFAALLARARVETWGPWFGPLVGLLALTAALALGAAVLLAQAWWRSRSRAANGAASPGEEADALDDIVAFLAVAGQRLPNLGAFFITGARWLDAALRSSWFSPRRRPWTFCVTVAVAFGVAFSSWHSLVEGLAPDPTTALRAWLVYAGVAAVGVVVATRCSAGTCA